MDEHFHAFQSKYHGPLSLVEPWRKKDDLTQLSDSDSGKQETGGKRVEMAMITPTVTNIVTSAVLFPSHQLMPATDFTNSLLLNALVRLPDCRWYTTVLTSCPTFCASSHKGVLASLLALIRAKPHCMSLPHKGDPEFAFLIILSLISILRVPFQVLGWIPKPVASRVTLEKQQIKLGATMACRQLPILTPSRSCSTQIIIVFVPYSDAVSADPRESLTTQLFFVPWHGKLSAIVGQPHRKPTSNLGRQVEWPGRLNWFP
ncbi:uncharacterized protein BDZ83DRAFT_763325 [Colletotrichum acutatum]|uniref:Uncharacterized protein n=1 Tax=Glomerella acutata TaxID=27357 RepID=A0AAD8UDH8_GLOAC|nr:uncharacterized protein BDZ83DRAFT_763325 [Colletotrichum acutatum]KAK1713767.1 hypothetical protein BDZ83DRAFT_763325 [Colletotrichum acutatum]